MNRDDAEQVGIKALVWLSQDTDRMAQFLAASGAGPEALRSQAQDPQFLGFVLDFVLSSDDMVMGLADAATCSPDQIVAARRALPGGEEVHWT